MSALGSSFGLHAPSPKARVSFWRRTRAFWVSRGFLQLIVRWHVKLARIPRVHSRQRRWRLKVFPRRKLADCELTAVAELASKFLAVALWRYTLWQPVKHVFFAAWLSRSSNAFNSCCMQLEPFWINGRLKMEPLIGAALKTAAAENRCFKIRSVYPASL